MGGGVGQGTGNNITKGSLSLLLTTFRHYIYNMYHN